MPKIKEAKPKNQRSLKHHQRLFEMLWLLQASSCTSEQLARHFAVSRRTIFRDIVELRDSNVTVDETDDGYRIPTQVLFSVHLDVAELVALLLLNDPPAIANLDGFARLRTVAIARILAGASKEDRAHAEHVVSNIRQLQVDGAIDAYDAPAFGVLLDTWLRNPLLASVGRLQADAGTLVKSR